MVKLPPTTGTDYKLPRRYKNAYLEAPDLACTTST